MDLTIRIEDYITQDEIKTVAMESLRDVILRTFSRGESEIERLISNLSYEFIFKAVSDAIGEDAKQKIANKVKELCEDGSAIRFEMWRKRDAWEKSESPALTILNEAIKDNKPLIRAKVEQCITGYEFNDIQDAMYIALDEILYEKVFGERSKQ